MHYIDVYVMEDFWKGEIMTTATIKTRNQVPVKRSGKARNKAAKKSPWTAIIIFLIFAGLVAYLFSPNVPDSQRAGSKGKMATNGFVGGLGK
ncbi:MAG: hypothetical protein HOK41_01995 [Nitrospina sp.]|jgi:hypothetical protein|nr:hypothetical protein [Nitrospina sp.]